jgi:hypothetical protein
MLPTENIAGARRAATTAVILAVTVILTTFWLVATCRESIGWLLTGEAVALAAIALVIRADLRPDQRHRVK